MTGVRRPVSTWARSASRCCRPGAAARRRCAGGRRGQQLPTRDEPDRADEAAAPVHAAAGEHQRPGRGQRPVGARRGNGCRPGRTRRRSGGRRGRSRRGCSRRRGRRRATGPDRRCGCCTRRSRVAPSALASWTARVPTPPEAPLIEDALAWLDPPGVAQTHERGDAGQRQGGRLLRRQVRRRRRDQGLGHAHVLGERAVGVTEVAEDGVTRGGPAARRRRRPRPGRRSRGHGCAPGAATGPIANRAIRGRLAWHASRTR